MDAVASTPRPLASGPLVTVSSPKRDISQAVPSSPGAKIAAAAPNPRLERTSPQRLGGGPGGKETASLTGALKWAGKTRFNSSAATKPLLPLNERTHQDDKTQPWRTRGKGSDEKVDITPEGGSAGRDGRQFTVANVGNNGRIYLRPSVRPAHQRYPQPNFVFPTTPPATAGLEMLTDKRGHDMSDIDASGSLWTPTPSSPATIRQQYFPGHSRRPTGHRRAMSDSTTRDDSEVGGFKVVISKPGDDKRPKTMEDVQPSSNMPLLDIDIPSWRIGNPRFTLKGTPFFRGSSYAPTEEFPRSSNVSFLRSNRGDLTPHLAERPSRKPSPISIPQLRFPNQVDNALKSPPIPSARLPAPYRSTYLSTHLVIEPAMFDALTFRPSCDDKTIVRYSTATGAVTAATPPRLVAEITSPSFLDYELISDFFLTYRAFLESSDLLTMLIARLRWALARDDEIGMVVRVRTFVAIRHWILNYFIDDFVVDYGLRVSFCNLLNDFVEELSQDVRARKVQLKILAELKKCWRRVCALYWDGPEFETSVEADAPIAPGGIAGHRSASLDPTFWERSDQAPRLSGLFASLAAQTTREETSFRADVSKAGHVTESVMPLDRPSTPEGRPTYALERQPTSPTSILSVDVISCSFPGKVSRTAQPGTNYPLAAHPVPPSSVYSTSAAAVATTPRALTGKRVRPNVGGHKRNGSMTDSLREKEHSTEKLGLSKDTEFLLSFPYAGSLVRGNLLPPGQPFVEVLPPKLADGQRETTVFQPAPLLPEKSTASAMSGQGMRRLIGSVRRALSTRGQGVSPTQGNFINITPIGPRGATTNRLPGTAIVPQARPRQNGIRPPVRIDLLGAETAEDFKKAVREDAAAEAERRGMAFRLPDGLHSALPGDMLDYSAAHMDTAAPADMSLSHLGPDDSRPLSDTAITTGSKSIVIVDDTVPFGLPVPLPARPAALSGVGSAIAHSESPSHLSIVDFGDNLVPTNADPTPPNTPPGNMSDTPRRSSHLLNHHVVRPSMSSEHLPPFVPDLATLEKSQSNDPAEGVISGSSNAPNAAPANDDFVRPSLDFSAQSPRRPPLTGSVRMHQRHRSSRTNRSLNSILHGRITSYRSDFVPQSTVRSFDATTTSGLSIVNDDDAVSIPRPLRVLRRRPGGNLRAANNVGDLDNALPLRKSRSVGSLTTYSDSIRSSYLRSAEQDSSAFVNVASGEFPPEHPETFSLGAMAEHPGKRNLSLFSTHSSKPIMRPSFEAEAQKLAQIPDDDDDGGVESALAKLEGKYNKKAFKLSMEPRSAPLPRTKGHFDAEYEHDETDLTEDDKKEHRHLHVGTGQGDAVLHHDQHHHHYDDGRNGTPTQGHGRPSTLHVPRQRPQTDVRSFLSDNSGVSYSSTPLLERDLTDDGRSKTATSEWRDRSVLFGPEDNSPFPTPKPSVFFESQHPSYEFVTKTESMEKIRPGDELPPSSERESFLDDDSDMGTDLSSELSMDILGSEDDEVMTGQAFPPMNRNASIMKMPPHPLAEPISTTNRRDSQNPPSPPITLAQALQLSPETANIPELHENQVWSQKPLPLPPTPDTTPTVPQHPEGTRDGIGKTVAFTGVPKTDEQELSKKYSVHLPFILAFDSEILAEQFTLIEKDALNEIDWKELIEMGWKNATNNDSRSWVEFLRNTDAHGVEVVIARFNIMVKWTCSEIVLTQDIEERARCIIKFIHIAAHCRRYRNFATMSQIAIALTSKEIARLTGTWAMVPPHDIKTLEELEALVSPMRNFHNLRAEMEGGSDSGCIPFVGIYTHDLLFNAQRPSEIASSPTTAPLVNFERCRFAATIVKTLLRLLEASTLYQFQPVEGITERCLWMSALSDEEIRKHSESLE